MAIGLLEAYCVYSIFNVVDTTIDVAWRQIRAAESPDVIFQDPGDLSEQTTKAVFFHSRNQILNVASLQLKLCPSANTFFSICKLHKAWVDPQTTHTTVIVQLVQEESPS